MDWCLRGDRLKRRRILVHNVMIHAVIAGPPGMMVVRDKSDCLVIVYSIVLI